MLGRAQVIAIVGVEALLDIGEVGSHAVAGQPARIPHVVDHGAVPLLRHRPGEERAEQPEQGHGLRAVDPLERQPIHDGEAGAMLEQAPYAGDGAAAMREIEIGRIERRHRERIGAQQGGDGQQLP